MNYREVRVQLQPNAKDEPNEEDYYIAVVMEYSEKNREWFNTGMVTHGNTPIEAFETAYKMNELRRIRDDKY